MKVVPDMQTGPAGYFLSWLLIGLVVIGLIFATGLGGALAWALLSLVAVIAIYWLWKQFIRRVM